MFDSLKNAILNRGRYKTHSDAVIVSCFFNPQNSPYRLLAFQKFYHSIKHLNHRIVECVIGESRPQLPHGEFISRVHSESLLWHKEALLNKLLAELPEHFQFVFWVDADVAFTNPEWLVDGVKQLQNHAILQPFEYCIHLERNQLKPDFDVDACRATVADPALRQKQMWRSFCANYVTTNYSGDENYDRHGHVGFAWGARRSVLEKVPLYDKGLIGGADHIIAHAAAGQIPHRCITKSFTADIDEVLKWSRAFYGEVRGNIGFVAGDLYHFWHGDIEKRQYLRRIQDFTGQARQIEQKDQSGLYVQLRGNAYMKNYYRQREVTFSQFDDFGDFIGFDDGFSDDMGYTFPDMLQQFADSPAPFEEQDFDDSNQPQSNAEYDPPQPPLAEAPDDTADFTSTERGATANAEALPERVIRAEREPDAAESDSTVRAVDDDSAAASISASDSGNFS